MILDKGFFQVPNAVFDNPDLGLNRYEKMVYIYLCRCGNQGADAFPGYGGIAKHCSIGRNTAVRTIKSLVLKELIAMTHRPKIGKRNQSNLYKVNDLPSAPQAPPLGAWVTTRQ